MFLAPQRVCKIKGDIVELIQTVRSAITVSGNVDGLGSFKNMKRWSKDPEVRGILKKVISDGISTPEIRFEKKDVDMGIDGRRLSVELSIDAWSSAPARELTVGSARVNFQILMTGENNEPGKKELALLAAKEMLEQAANDTTSFVGALRQELLTSPNWQSIYPPDLNVLISQPVISVAVEKKGEVTPAPTPPPTPEPEPGFWYYAPRVLAVIAFFTFCALWVRSCNKTGEGKKGKKGRAKVAPDKPGKGEKSDSKEAPAATDPKSEKPEGKKTDEAEEAAEDKKEPEDIEGKGGGEFKSGKKIQKPSEKARGLPEDEEVPETGKPVAEPEGEPPEGEPPAGEPPAGEAKAQS
jgi:hypothetical protein